MENKSKLRDWWWWCVYVCSYPMDYAEDDEADMVREGLPRDGRQEEGTGKALVYHKVCRFFLCLLVWCFAWPRRLYPIPVGDKSFVA